jgi:hypothetical protein
MQANGPPLAALPFKSSTTGFSYFFFSIVFPFSLMVNGE